MTLKPEKVKVVSIPIISELSKKKETEYTDSFSHGINPLFRNTSWLNEKPQIMTLFSIASAKQCFSNLIFLTLMTIPLCNLHSYFQNEK